MVSEKNLEKLRDRRAKYITGTPRSWLKDFQKELADQDWQEIEEGVEVKAVTHPKYSDERFVLCKSQGRRDKERAILERQKEGLEKELVKIKKGICSGRLKDIEKTERRIGRWLGRYPKADPLFSIVLIKDEAGTIIDLSIQNKKDKSTLADKVHGAYLLRTNIDETDPGRLWKTYMQLSQAESAFRMSKSDLGLRPIFHQRTDRVQAHIFICFLALAMWKTLELWMDSKGLGRSPNKLIREFREIHSLDSIVPIKERPSLRLRVIGKPDTHVRILLHALGIKLPNRPLSVGNVVQTFGV